MQEPTGGAEELPFFMTVNPKPVDAAAVRFPLPFGFMVMTLPLESQLGVPFQAGLWQAGVRGSSSVAGNCAGAATQRGRLVNRHPRCPVAPPRPTG